jgi:heptosyltransferase I
MRVLIVKTSSMGDIIHTLPALTDAAAAIPNIEFDWLVEESFQAIPAWHYKVNKVIPLALRRWRKDFISSLRKGEMKSFFNNLRALKYDMIIDAQGLTKSAVLSFLARGKRFGLDWTSAREHWASLWYHQRSHASWDDHAVSRVRQLFAQSLNYELPNSPPNYGIDLKKLAVIPQEIPYFIFLHGTTWATKHWPESYWIELGKIIASSGYKIKLLFGNELEKNRAERIQSQVSSVEVLPKLSLTEVAGVLAGAKGIVSVDTGLGHLAAALNVKTVSLYGPSDPLLTGTQGLNQIHLKANFPCAPCFKRDCQFKGDKSIEPPCFASLSPERVWNELCRQ